MPWKKIISDKSYEVDSIVDFFNEKNGSSISLTPLGIKNLKTLIKKNGVDKVLDAINEAYDKYIGLDIEAMWNKLPSVLGFINATDEDRNKMKFFGGVKARFTGTYGYKEWDIIETNKIIRKLYEIIDSNETGLTYSYLFKVLNRNSTYRDFKEDITELYNEF